MLGTAYPRVSILSAASRAADPRDVQLQLAGDGAQEDAAVPASIIGETFGQKAARLREKSLYGSLPTWALDGLIAKSNDDLRQEVFVMQLIGFYKKVFAAAQLPSWLYTYKIMSGSQRTGQPR